MVFLSIKTIHLSQIYAIPTDRLEGVYYESPPVIYKLPCLKAFLWLM